MYYSIIKILGEEKIEQILNMKHEKKYINENKLYQGENDKSLFIVSTQDHTNRFVKIIFKKVNGANYLDFKNIETLVLNLLEKGIVLSGYDTKYPNHEEYQELMSLVRTKFHNNTYNESDLKKAKELLNYIVEDNEITSISISKKIGVETLNFKLYSTGLLFMHTAIDNETMNLYHNEIEKFAFEIFKYIIQEDFVTVELNEKEKIEHPLKNAEQVLNMLYNQSGNEVQSKLNIEDEEWNEIKKYLLKKTKELNKEIYIED